MLGQGPKNQSLESLQRRTIGQRSSWAELSCDEFTIKAWADLTGAQERAALQNFPLEATGPGHYTSVPTSHWMWAALGEGRRCDFGAGGRLQLRAIPGERLS